MLQESGVSARPTTTNHTGVNAFPDWCRHCSSSARRCKLSRHLQMTSNDPSRQQAVNHWDPELPGQSNRSNTEPGHRRIGRVRPEGARALLYNFEERPESGLIIPWCCACPHSSLLQGRFFRLCISTHQTIDQHAQTVVSSSRHHPCGLRHR